MSALPARITPADVPVRPAGNRRPHPPFRLTRPAPSGRVERSVLEREIPELDCLGRDGPAPCRGAPPARRFDRESRAWVEALHAVGVRRAEAIGRLHALLLREARFEVRRRTAALAHPSGRDLDDLAMQAADDAVVAILAKLDQFRGDSLFTTWARRFVELETPAKIRRRLGRAAEYPTELECDRATMWPTASESPHERCVANELARTLARLIGRELTEHQREVLIALTINDVATEELAHRLDTSSGALYKTLHDARRKLKTKLGDA
jgi:RNA polymerase sigma-70 factor (ECF subfamily)